MLSENKKMRKRKLIMEKKFLCRKNPRKYQIFSQKKIINVKIIQNLLKMRELRISRKESENLINNKKKHYFIFEIKV